MEMKLTQDDSYEIMSNLTRGGHYESKKYIYLNNHNDNFDCCFHGM